MGTGERRILFYHTSSYAGITRIRCYGYDLSPFIGHPFKNIRIALKRKDLPSLPTPALPGSGYKGTISAFGKAPPNYGAKVTIWIDYKLKIELIFLLWTLSIIISSLWDWRSN
jgi:hypothetical protein